MQPVINGIMDRIVFNICHEYITYGKFYHERHFLCGEIVVWEFNGKKYRVCEISDSVKIHGDINNLIPEVMEFKKTTMAQAILFSLLDKLEIPND